MSYLYRSSRPHRESSSDKHCYKRFTLLFTQENDRVIVTCSSPEWPLLSSNWMLELEDKLCWPFASILDHPTTKWFIPQSGQCQDKNLLTLQELIPHHVALLKILFYTSSSRHYECNTNTSFSAVQIQMLASQSARLHTLPTKKVYISTTVDIMELSSPRLLLGLPLDAESGAELLSWAISVAAHPNDTITALHVLGTSYF